MKHVCSQFPCRTLVLAGFLSALASVTAVAESPEPEAYYRHVITYECFGIFWVSAEIYILRVLRSLHNEIRPPAANSPKSTRLKPARHTAYRILPLAALLLGRHLFLNPYSPAQNSIDILEGRAAAFIIVAQIVWSGFIVTWVCLEIAIVREGIRLYRTLIGPTSKTLPSPNIGAMVLTAGAAVGLVCMHRAGAADMTEHAFSRAFAATEDLRSGVLLLLRIAGAVWIVVEWIAAFFLVKGFYELKRRIGNQNHNTHSGKAKP